MFLNIFLLITLSSNSSFLVSVIVSAAYIICHYGPDYSFVDLDFWEKCLFLNDCLFSWNAQFDNEFPFISTCVALFIYYHFQLFKFLYFLKFVLRNYEWILGGDFLPSEVLLFLLFLSLCLAPFYPLLLLFHPAFLLFLHKQLFMFLWFLAFLCLFFVWCVPVLCWIT